MEDAVTKLTVRRGGGDFTERRSAIVVISGSTIPKLSGLANSFGAAFRFILAHEVARHAGRGWDSLVA